MTLSPVRRITAKLPAEVGPVIRRLSIASLIGQLVLIVTGGAVRLTASGLGCPTWPRCTAESLTNTPEMGIHGVIEFGNRALTFALAFVALLMLVFLWNIRRERRDLFVLALALLASIPAQAVVGGITVLSNLNPWVVGLHFLISIALVSVATLLVNRTFGRSGRFVTGTVTPVGKTLKQLSVVLLVFTIIAVCLGVAVTGAGPHAGDANAPRNGLDWDFITRIHVVPVYVLVAGAAAALVLAHRQRAPRDYRKGLHLFTGALLLQGLIGYVQYFNGVPELLVGMHMLCAALLLAAATNLADLAVRQPHSPETPQAAAQA